MKKTTIIHSLAVSLAAAVSCVASQASDSNQPSAENGASFRTELRQLYDRNGDGALDADERKSLEVDLQRGKIPIPASLRSREQVHAFRARVMATYDADENGTLDQWEFLNLEWDIVEGGKKPAGHTAIVVADHGG